MTNRERIINAINFAELNLKEGINVHDLAREACCSLYHFIRLFKSLTGMSPKKYLLKRRLTESVSALKDSDKKIVDIAFDYQFSSHEVFTRAFQKQFGITPSKIRQGEAISSLLLVQPISVNYLHQSKEARNQAPELLELEEMSIVGLSFFISGNLKKLDLSVQWHEFMQAVDLIQHKAKPAEFFQIQYWSENQSTPGMHFFIGVEVSALKDVLPQFVIKIIPKGSYLKFIHKGLSRNVGYTYRYIYEEFLPSTDYKLSLPFNFEHYGKTYLSPNDENSESFLFIPVDQ